MINNENYLKQNLDIIIKKLYSELLINKPSDILHYMKLFLENEIKIKNNLIKYDSESFDSCSENADSVCNIEDIKKNKINLINKKKVSVSAEVFGEYNKLSEFKPRIINKSADIKNKILNKLNQAFMFSNLDENEKNIVVDAMEEIKYKPNDYVIKQGDNGDVLFLVEEGDLDCYKKFNKDDEKDTYLKTYYPGESFGELALLYNVPRAASIISKTQSTWYALDRYTFNNIVKLSAIKKRVLFEQFLESIEILKTLNKGELVKLCDCLKVKVFKKGDFIIKQGDEGNSFFIIKSGNLKAIKKSDTEEQVVYEYKEKMYFGELSLLQQNPRAASILVVSDDSEILELDRFAFNNLLGPLENILKRNTEMYKKFIPVKFTN